ncbi:MAG: hypothetical protein J6C27_00870 [Clostridia bacterium]|nr:hypothetical protein [Clostridia bacterium]
MAVYSTQRAEAKKKVNDIHDLQAEQVNKAHAAGVKEIGTAYDDQQRAVAVQKLINERKVAESMANLGLTDSGLNRTQQTAVQLSAANAAYNLNRQKQADINAYNLDRDSKLSTIEQNRISATAGVDETYDGLEAEYEAAQAKAAAEAAVIKTPTGKTGLLMSAEGNLNPYYTGSLGQNSIAVDYTSEEGYTIYTDYATGVTKKINSKFNPYTDTKNNDVENGAFDNGYQPNNIKGEKLKLADKGAWKAFGQNQNVFYTGEGSNKKYWVWSRGNNAYIEVYLKDNQWKARNQVIW